MPDRPATVSLRLDIEGSSVPPQWEEQTRSRVEREMILIFGDRCTVSVIEEDDETIPTGTPVTVLIGGMAIKGQVVPVPIGADRRDGWEWVLFADGTSTSVQRKLIRVEPGRVA